MHIKGISVQRLYLCFRFCALLFDFQAISFFSALSQTSAYGFRITVKIMFKIIFLQLFELLCG